RRPKKSPTVAQTMGNEASNRVNRMVKTQSCQLPASHKSGGTDKAGSRFHIARRLGLFSRSASHPRTKWGPQMARAKAPRRDAAAPSDNPFHTMTGTKCTVAAL